MSAPAEASPADRVHTADADRVLVSGAPASSRQFERPRHGPAAVQVGTLRITTHAQVWERGLDWTLDPSAFAIDRLPLPDPPVCRSSATDALRRDRPPG